MPASVFAHNTLFGHAPRTIWKGGLEFEVDTHWELYKRFFDGDSSIGNPRDVQVNVWTFSPAFTYGISRDLSVRAMLPVAYASRTSKDGDDSYFGLKDWRIAAKYRLYYDPVPGGSFQGGVFAEFMLPTAQARDPGGLLGEDISFGNDSFGFKLGATWAYSTMQQYFWLDVVGEIHTVSDGMTKGASFRVHPAYAVRVFELTDYRDFDLILLFEGDLEVRDKHWMDRRRVVPSGYHKIHLSAGLQFNITNRIEIKTGFELPVYQYYRAPTFVHEGTLKLSFNYLF